MALVSFSELIREALAEKLRENSDVVLLGEDIGVYGGAFGVTKGLLEEFGKDRVIDTPISESGFTGLAIGMALQGMRPVVEIQFMDFCLQIMDQFFNQAAKFDFIYDGAAVPVVVRTPSGGRRGYGATHSQCLESLFSHLPGVHVACPHDPHDAKSMLRAAIDGTVPTLFSEHKLLYAKQVEREYQPEVLSLRPGQARVLRRGSDVTIFSYSYSLELTLRALDHEDMAGIDATIVDLRYLRPLDRETIIKEVARTRRAVIIEEGHKTLGIGAEIAAIIAETDETRGAVVRRVAAVDIPIPSSPVLEKLVLPESEVMRAAILDVARTAQRATPSPRPVVRAPAAIAVQPPASAAVPAPAASLIPTVASGLFAVTVPRMGMNEDEVKIVAWHVNVGEPVRKGQNLLEVETDKATFEVEAEQDGYLVHQAAVVGETLGIGEILGHIGAEKDIGADFQTKASLGPMASEPVPQPARPAIDSARWNSIGSRRVVIIGAATTAGQVYEAMRHDPNLDIIGFVDQSPDAIGRRIGAASVLGNVSCLPELMRKEGVDSFFVAIGNGVARVEIGAALIALGLEPVNAIHPRAIVAESAYVGRGVLVEGNAQIGWGAHVGDFCKVDMNSVVEHDCIVGRGCHLAPSVTLGGCVHIGNMTLLNIGTVVGSNLKVGNYCVSAPNSAIERDLQDFAVVRGSPAQVEGTRRADSRPKFLDQTLDVIRNLTPVVSSRAAAN